MVGVADAYLDQTLAERYRLVSHLADGGFSHVFKATDQRTGALVAVKVLKPDVVVHPESGVEFDHEGELLEVLGKSRNVVGLLDSANSIITVTVNENPLPVPVRFHVMELAEAALSELLPLRHEIDWVDKLRLFRDVVAGVHQMHVKGIVHRDLKASNVLLFDTETRRPVAKISDLGRSRDLSRPQRFDLGAYAAGRGDRNHAPPEHLWHLGNTDETAFRRADVYMVGSVLYEIATGQSITSMTLPYWGVRIGGLGPIGVQDREARFLSAARHMVEAHEAALGVLADEVPPEIRNLVVDLVRQMCHPLPVRRERRSRAERNTPTCGLEWAIRRVDIIIKNLEHRRAVTATAIRRQRT
jgi:serine/threonine protein kinase